MAFDSSKRHSRSFRRNLSANKRKFKEQMNQQKQGIKRSFSPQDGAQSSNNKMKKMSGNRYFDLSSMKSLDNSPTQQQSTPNTHGTGSIFKKMAIKRKPTPNLTSDFISLNSTDPGPSPKQRKLDTNNNRKSDIPVLVISSDEETPTSSPCKSCETSLFGRTPYSLKEAERLFMSDSVSSQMHEFFVSNRQKESFLTQKRQLQTALEKAINRTMGPGSHLLLVGSSINGFGRVSSDADFCLVIDQYQEKIQNRSRVMKTLYSLQQLLRRAPFTRNMQVIPAKVPILKFVDSFSGMECDININNLTGIRNTELMKRYAMLDPRVQPLTLVIKEWAHQRGINDASQGTLSSYSLVLMVIHFLQCGVHPSVLPSLQSKHPECFRTATPVMEVERIADRVRAYRSENDLNLFQLLLKFFEYFSEEFDFERKVMSVRLGKVIEVRDVNSPFLKEWTKPIKIEEPFDRSNTARAVHNVDNGRKVFKQFRNAFFTLQRKRSLDALIPSFTSQKRKNSHIVISD